MSSLPGTDGAAVNGGTTLMPEFAVLGVEVVEDAAAPTLRFKLGVTEPTGREIVGDVQVQHGELSATEIGANEVPLLVDELPLVALLAASAHGETIVRGAAELRVKESDRIEAVTDLLRATGAHVKSREDGWAITGVPTRLRGGNVEARGDHRIAMLGAVVGLASREGVDIEDAETVAISFPGFYEVLDSLVRR